MSRIVRGPSPTVAAAFLRDIARQVGLPIADPARRAADLRLIADCIERRGATFTKGGKYSFSDRAHITAAARRIDKRPPGTSVGDAATNLARQVAQTLGRPDGDPDDEIRTDILAARKLIRRMDRGK